MNKQENVVDVAGTGRTERPSELSELDQLGAWIDRLLWPTDEQGGRVRRLLPIRRAVGVVTVVGTLVQLVVWLLIAVFSGDLDSPWWLFTTIGGTVAAVSLRIVDEHGFGSSSAPERSK